MTNVLRLRVVVYWAMAAWISGCGSPTPPGNNSNPPSLTVLLAPPEVDTVDAEPTDAYVLSLTNGDGTPVVGATVLFAGSNAEVAVPGEGFQASTSAQTDSRGEVAVAIRFGTEAGPGSVVASVATVQLTHTLELDVAPGATVGPAIMPEDTAVVVGVPFVVTASPVDRHGNATGDALAVTVDFGPVAAAGSQFTGTALGEARLSAELAEHEALATVRVVPDGQLVYTKGVGAWLARFDGGGPPQQLSFLVPSAAEPSVSWNPAGDRIVLGGLEGFTVFDLGGSFVLPTAWPGGTAGSDVRWPRFGPGERVYYSSADGQGAWDLRAANPDGTSAQVTIESSRFPNDDLFPDWAPDGSQFVFTADWEENSRFLLRISDASADQISTIEVEGVTPVWSPDGALIAYQELGVVGVVSPDGTISRSWEPGWSKGVTWSPGSDMLVGVSAGQIAVIDVETGETVVLTHFGTGIDAVAWRPQ